MTTLMSCSISSSVRPRAAAIRRMSAVASLVSPGVMPAVGSSSRSRRGLGGQGQADLEIALLAVGEVLRQLVAPAARPKAPSSSAALASTSGCRQSEREAPRLAGARLRGHADVLEHRDLREHVGDLERLGEAQPVDGLGRAAR